MESVLLNYTIGQTQYPSASLSTKCTHSHLISLPATSPGQGLPERVRLLPPEVEARLHEAERCYERGGDPRAAGARRIRRQGAGGSLHAEKIQDSQKEILRKIASKFREKSSNLTTLALCFEFAVTIHTPTRNKIATKTSNLCGTETV